MFRLRFFTALVVLVFLVTIPVSAQHTAETLLEVERSWLAAYDNHDVEAMQKIVADGFVITYADGTKLTKQGTIASLKPGTPSNPYIRQFTENSEVRFFGSNTAVISGIYNYAISNAEGEETRIKWLYTDTYMWLDGRWQVIASHLSSSDRLN